MKTLTRSERRVLEYIRRHLEENDHESPSYEEIARGVGLKSASNIQAHIEKLMAKGYLTKKPNSHRSIELTATTTISRGSEELPLVGRIAAGKPIEAVLDYETITIPADMIGKNETFVLKVRGDSMIEDHVLDGDYVIIERRTRARDGEMVVALVNNSEATLKRFYREGNGVRLEPANPAYAPMHFAEEDVTVQGVVIGILRKYGRR